MIPEPDGVALYFEVSSHSSILLYSLYYFTIHIHHNNNFAPLPTPNPHLTHLIPFSSCCPPNNTTNLDQRPSRGGPVTKRPRFQAPRRSLYAMLKKKSLAPSFFWNFTPSTTPELSPTSSDSDSDEDMDSSGSRPVSLAVSAGAFCPMRPTLNDVLANTAPPPYTLSAFMAYLSQNHCLETLEFTLEAQRYRDTYHSLAERLDQSVLLADTPESQHLRMLWHRLLSAYIFPGSPREINLSSEVRDGLLRHKDVVIPPVPETLDSAVKRIHDLMEESIFLPFLNAHTTSPSMAPQSEPPFSPDDTISLPNTSLDEHPMKRVRSRAKRISPPILDKGSTRNRRPLKPFNWCGPRSRKAGFGRSSHPQSSPTAEEPMTPPTTPPASEPHLPINSPKLRTENPWKKMGMKLGFKKRSGGASGSRADPKILGLDE
ncbi:Regulator of G protein signaling superfamily [Penicillium citrinum]|uniref:Regulator of G protein signaling superfamily n=1 Tax=Penicillium citrinum TaxID=5077 RepID=A0A9W9ND16_PENCI|nr:Regulator of G protein signaling superfamily [Penicillium citrinum]KAJ5217612.1 Regulator of G protein signaling superfamily [Penicillium citrinum]